MGNKQYLKTQMQIFYPLYFSDDIHSEVREKLQEKKVRAMSICSYFIYHQKVT